MTIWITSTLLVIGILWIIFVQRNQLLSTRNLRNLEGMQQIDIEAFKNLIDIHQEQFLRNRLKGSAFRKVKRVRLKAVLSYLRPIFSNSRQLVIIGHANRCSSDGATARAAAELLSVALHMRLLSIKCILLVCLEVLLPRMEFAMWREAPRVYAQMDSRVLAFKMILSATYRTA